MASQEEYAAVRSGLHPDPQNTLRTGPVAAASTGFGLEPSGTPASGKVHDSQLSESSAGSLA
jgi:hypothetical protein